MKLAKANNALGDLKKKVSALQTTITTYSSHIQRINEKKRKLITDISEDAFGDCSSNSAGAGGSAADSDQCDFYLFMLLLLYNTFFKFISYVYLGENGTI